MTEHHTPYYRYRVAVVTDRRPAWQTITVRARSADAARIKARREPSVLATGIVRNVGKARDDHEQEDQRRHA